MRNRKVFSPCLPMVLFLFSVLTDDYIGTGFLYSCPASRGNSLRQHGLLVLTSLELASKFNVSIATRSQQ